VNRHCYAKAQRNIARFGGVLASIDYVDTTSANANGGQVNEEEWITFEGQPGWIETGQSSGIPYGPSEMHPFYAQQKNGASTYQESLCACTVPLNNYNHYVLFDSERNGRWHIYWGCCEVGYYGGGWHTYLTEQQAGIEVASEVRPYEWGRQMVADSNGGAWTAWNGIEYERSHGICMQQNVETPTAEGNIMWGTLGGPPNTECY
jgi:hypothetical protein